MMRNFIEYGTVGCTPPAERMRRDAVARTKVVVAVCDAVAFLEPEEIRELVDATLSGMEINKQ